MTNKARKKYLVLTTQTWLQEKIIHDFSTWVENFPGMIRVDNDSIEVDDVD